jgi:hypothetical protein
MDPGKPSEGILRNRPFLFLLILFILLLSYVAYNEYSWQQYQGLIGAAQVGYSQGVVDTVAKLYEETEACQPVPVALGNLTKYVIDVSCLQTQGT